jgi:organic hydroperoxide reductase OsmC/OhrA
VATTHTYRCTFAWSSTSTSSTAGGYRAYSREHEVVTVPVEEVLPMSGDPTFGGDAALRNPEQLLLAAAGSCQLLSFLALAARARIDVLGYSDDASAEMPVTRGPMRIARIVLRPVITVPAGTDVEQVLALVPQAHEECFIANSLNSELVIEPTVTLA